MTHKQRRIIAALAVANTIVILALVVLVMRPSGIRPSPLPPRHTPTLPHSPAPPQGACQWKATQLLAQAGLGGTVALTPGGPLRFEIAYSLVPGQTADEAAQLVWAALDVALALDEGECGSFTEVEVTILAQSNQADVFTSWQIKASVSAADLAAFGAGELSEDEFVERVVYTTTALP